MSGVRSSLVFKQIDLRRTPGISKPFSIENLCQGINVAYGPNASGKTTTALAIQALLWNTRNDAWKQAAVVGRAELDGSDWYIEIDAGLTRCQRDGQDGATLPVDDADGGSRYILTLHDLLQADNRDFAEVILRESAGGYDLGKARDELGYRVPTGRANARTGAVRTAKKRKQEAEQLQIDLLREERDLERLRDDLRSAQKAATEAAVLERAIVAKDRMRELDEAHAHLVVFPDRIANVRGDELEQLSEIRDRRVELERRQRQAESEIEQARLDRRESRLEGVDLPGEFLPTLRRRAESLRVAETDLTRIERDIAEQETYWSQSARRLGGSMTDQQLRDLEAGKLKELTALGTAYEEARLHFQNCNDLLRWVGQPEKYDQIDKLQQGISHLNAWLRAGRSIAVEPASDRTNLIAWVAAGIIASISLIAGIVGHPLLILFFWLGVIPVVLARLRPTSRNQDTQTTDRATYAREEYERLGLDGPPTWTVQEVEALADRLTGELHRQRQEQLKANKWGHLDDDMKAAKTELEARKSEWQSALQQAGLDEVQPAELMLLAQNLDRWQEADNRLQASRELLQTERQSHEEALRVINADLARVGFDPASSYADVHGCIEDLSRRLQQLESAGETIERTGRLLEEEILPDLEACIKEYREIFEELGLEVDDETTLADWVEQRDQYIAARDAVREAEVIVQQMRDELGDQQHLLQSERDELGMALHDARERAARAATLQEQIIQIQTQVDAAKKDRNLEDAIAELERASDELRAEREEQGQLLAGWMVSEYLRERTRDRDRPAVFHRARGLFSRITQGRYELQFSDDPTPTFRATDQTTGISHGLNELSSATRVQLLLAVRLAFVEEMERGPKLPIILDETLGNADEYRAEAIIRAACEICRTGRQVFYFTAQQDEVAKWRRLITEHDDIPCSIINIAEARQLPEMDASVLSGIESNSQPPAVPAPNGASHQGYHDMIHVPAIDPWSDLGSVHLWYLVHDPVELHRLLSMGVPTWGQLRSIVEYGGDDLVSPQVYAAASARATALQAAVEGWRTGKSRPIDRSTVYSSEAFTPTFQGRVAQQVERVNGDPVRLIKVLEAGRVSRLRTDYIEAFEDYLIEHDYLPSSDPLDVEDIRARVLAAASEPIADGLLTPADVDFLLGCLPLDDGNGTREMARS